MELQCTMNVNDMPTQPLKFGDCIDSLMLPRVRSLAAVNRSQPDQRNAMLRTASICITLRYKLYKKLSYRRETARQLCMST